MNKLLRHAGAAGILIACALAPAAGAVTPAGVGVPAGASAPAGTASGAERWWVVRLAGQPTGWFRESVATAEGGGSRTEQEMLFVINRLGSRVEIRTLVAYVEDASGKLAGVHAETSSSRQSTVLDGTVTPAGLVLRTTTGGREYSRTVPLAGPALGPQGIAALCRARLRAPGDRVSYLAFAPDAAAVRRVSRTATASAQPGGSLVLQAEERTEQAPGVLRLWLDARGEMVRSLASMPFGEVETVRAERAAAERAAAGSELPAEAYDRTMARSNVRLPDPRAIEAMTIRLTHRRPDLGWPDFQGPTERVLEKTADTLVLEVRRPAVPLPGAAAAVPASAGQSGKAGPSGPEGFLAPNAVLQSDDPEVVRLAHTIAGDETDPWTVARRLQDWTATHLDLDLGIALAPASEVARNRRGTCIAFAVLLASLERAAGIPSRLAMGFVYYKGIWGGHAWTEVRIGDRWVPLDAAAYAPGPADAARFQFGSYTGEDNLGAASAAGLQTYGNIEVTVLAYAVHGRMVTVPAGAAPFTVEGDVYRNPWLSVAVTKPAGSRFAALDAVYPDSTVVAVKDASARLTVGLESPRHEPAEAVRGSLAEIGAGEGTAALLGGRPAAMLSLPNKVRLVAADGDALWVLTAEGQGAGDLLSSVAARWQWTSPN